MTVDQNLRPEFYEDQYLGADDLDAVVDYSRLQLARHILAGHTWGIAMGLELTEKPSPAGGDQVEISILPGYAWDGFGRTIVLLTAEPLSAEAFKDIAYNASLDNNQPKGRLVEVWLRYRETPTRGPRPGFESCKLGDQFSRVEESFEILIGRRPNHKDRHDPVFAGGREVDAQSVYSDGRQVYDESVPYQIFPGPEDPDRWLISLGKVRWLPNTDPSQLGHFVKREPEDLIASLKFRRSIGVVAEELIAPDQVVRIRQRTREPSTVWSNDLAWVEGKLRVDDDIRLFGGQLDFRESAGTDKDFPLHLRRQYDQASVSGKLEIVLGKESNGNNRFSIGPLSGTDDAIDEKLVVLDNAHVGIGISDPLNSLHVARPGYLNAIFDRTDSPEHLTVVVGSSGSGLRFSETNAFFIASQPYADRNDNTFGNEHLRITSAGRVGIGTSNPTGRVTIDGIVQPQQGTMTLFSQTADFEYDGGSDGLFVFKDTGGKTAFMGGNVGIGTTSPEARLTVSDATMGVRGIEFIGGGVNSHIPWSDGEIYLTGDRRSGATGTGDFNFRTYDGSAYSYKLTVKGNSGNVGIGTRDPATLLHVEGTTDTSPTTHGLLVLGSTAGNNISLDQNEIMARNNGAVSPLYLNHEGGNVIINGANAAGNVGIGTTSPGNYRLFVNGALSVVGSARRSNFSRHWDGSSDKRLKKNIQVIEGALEKILRLRGVSFEWRESDKEPRPKGKQMDFIAQEVEEVFPEWVGIDADGFKTLRPDGFEAVTVEAMRELKKEAESISARLEQCEAASRQPKKE